MKITIASIIVVQCLLISNQTVFGQAEVTGWGNLRGIRVGGQLVSFGTAVGIYNSDFTQVTLSRREGGIRTSRYDRDGNTVTVTENLNYGGRGGGGRGARGLAGAATNPAAAGARSGRGGRGGGAAGGFAYTMSYTDSAPGTCDVKIQLTSAQPQNIAGVYYFLTLPASDFANGTVDLIGSAGIQHASLATPNDQGKFVTATATAIRIYGKNRQSVEVNLPQPLEFVVQQSTNRNNPEIQVFFPIITGNTTANQTVDASFTLKASCDPDTSPVTVTVDPSKTGREWLGAGGNYRIQDLQRDPPHIQYILDNMRVAYARVAMPWNTWQPQEDQKPPLLTPAGYVGAQGDGGGMDSIDAAIDMADKLNKLHIPIMMSVWFPPQWATIQNGGGFGGGGGGRLRGRLDPAKWDKICESLGSYLLYLKEKRGVEVELFSFNESNIGINVQQSPQDHAEAIKKLGAHFQKIGLKTKMLLGDTGDVPPINFINAAMNDPEAVPFIGAVSFHSWRGATDEQYQKWADAATKLGVPLFDAEGGNDAQASTYRNIFRETWYALDEAAEYVRIMRICQPKAILQWQLTYDYSPLVEVNGALQPTQRFYNLKQMSFSRAPATWISVNSDHPLVLPAAFVHKKSGEYTIHLVNNGAARQATVSGLPASISLVDVYVTNQNKGMQRVESVTPQNGTVKITLQGQSFTTLINPVQSIGD